VKIGDIHLNIGFFEAHLRVGIEFDLCELPWSFQFRAPGRWWLLVKPGQGFEIQREVRKIGPEKDLDSTFHYIVNLHCKFTI
jgi:hypothetical protein